MDENDYLANRLNDQIDWYSKKSEWNQWWYKLIKRTEMILSALIPVLMAFWSDNFYAKFFIATAGGTITVLAGINGLYKFHENWIEYRSTSETLKHEKYMFLTRTGVYANDENAFQCLVERVESIISHENINWAQLNRCNNENSTNLNN